MEIILSTREFLPGMKRVELPHEMKLSLKEPLEPFSTKTCNQFFFMEVRSLICIRALHDNFFRK